MEQPFIKQGLQNDPNTYYGAVDTMADNKGISLDEHDISQIIIKDDPVTSTTDLVRSDESCHTKCVTYISHHKYKLYVCLMMMLTYFIMQCHKLVLQLFPYK